MVGRGAKIVLWHTPCGAKTVLFLLPALLGLAAGVAPPVHAEIRQSVRIDATHALTHLGDGDWGFAGIGRARLDFLSAGNQFARGQLRIDATIVDAAIGDESVPAGLLLDIPRAWVRARFPLGESFLHTTAGRARITWGDGAFFNAGDTIFGAVSRDADLTADTIRDEARWLWSAFIPLGPFAFIEPILLAPEVRIEADAGASSIDAALGAETPGVWNLSVGGRVQGQIAGIKSEAGYLYRGRELLHTVSASAQGHLRLLPGGVGSDLYASASTDLPAPGAEESDAAWENLALSAGALQIHRLGGDATLSLRLESLWRPAAAWSDRGDPAAVYALTLFPEVIWSPARNASVFLRSIVSPVDGSAMIIPGGSWNIFQDFTMSLFAFVAAGESSDVFHPNRSGGATVQTTFSFVY